MTAALVFDAGPMSHFAEAGWLRILEAVAGERKVLIPELVRSEVAQGCHDHSFLQQVLDAEWIHVDRSDDVQLLVVQAAYTVRLASGAKNLGECGVLALAEVRGYTAVVDDRVARQVGEERGVNVSGTLALLCEAIRSGLLTVSLVARIADDLLATQYRLPLGPGGFKAWATEQGF